MREFKVYLASALFICLTAVKLCFPQLPSQLRRQVGDLLFSGRDYGQTIQAMGRSLAQGKLEEQLVQALEYIGPGDGGRQEAVQVGETWDVPLSGGVAPEAAGAEDNASGSASGLELPHNVSSQVPALPFEYVSPGLGKVSSRFGYREDPMDGEAAFHYGVDLAADSGDKVLAFAQGVVLAAGTDEGYGNYCLIQHPEAYVTLYAHMEECLVQEEQEVEKGQLIGYVGQSGKATGPHLHFELLCQGSYLDPENYL